MNKWNSTKEYEQKQTKLSQLNKKDDSDSDDISKDLKVVNKTGKKGYVRNCFNCVCAFEMRQRGYDVSASPRSQGTTEEEYKKYFKGVKIKSAGALKDPKETRKQWAERCYDSLCQELSSYGPNARGFVSFAWENAVSGHTMTWVTNSSGEVYFYDPQDGKKNATSNLSLSNQQYIWARLDNCRIDDSITKVVENRKEKK